MIVMIIIIITILIIIIIIIIIIIMIIIIKAYLYHIGFKNGLNISKRTTTDDK